MYLKELNVKEFTMIYQTYMTDDFPAIWCDIWHPVVSVCPKFKGETGNGHFVPIA